MIGKRTVASDTERGAAARTAAILCALATLASSETYADMARAGSADECITSAERAQPLQHDGKLKAAREKLLVCSRPVCPSVVQADCAKWLADLDALMPSLVVRAVDAAGTDVLGIRLLVDGKPQELRFEGEELQLDPGLHSVRVEHQRMVPIEQVVVVRESEQHRIVSVTLVPVAQALQTEAPVRQATASAAAMHVASERPPGRSRVVPIVLLIAGGAGLALATSFWVAGLSDRSSMTSGCAPTHSCARSDVDSARQNLVVGDVIGGASIVAASVGAGLYWLSGDRASQATALVLGPVSGGARLEVRGRF
jgi:hypothetical protein